METVPSPLLENAVRPLLRLAQIVTGAKWTLVTSIERERRRNRPLSLPPPPASTDDDDLCIALVVGDAILGELRCADSGRPILDADQREGLRLIAVAMQRLLEFEQDKSQALASAAAAGIVAEQAHGASLRDALHSQRMERLAHTDVLTGLPNRRAFMQRWVDALARSRRRGHCIGLMLLDADRFKAINDSQGHAKGDAILEAIGATLLSVGGSADFAARIGGDEFALFRLHTDDAKLHVLAEEIRVQFKLLAAELGVDATLSIGMVSSESCPSDDMFAHADLALYRSKEAGGDTERMYHCEPAPELAGSNAPE